MIEDGLSLVIPIYNERKSIPSLLQSLEALQAKAPDAIEIILVNDGSTDGTDENLKDIKADYVKVINHSMNRGYGASLKTGIRMAKYAWVAIIDADDTYPIMALLNLLQHAQKNKCDMVVGSRNGQNVKIPLIRRPAKWTLNVLANWLSGYTIPDLNSGMRIMLKQSVNKFLMILPNGFSFTTTITLAMLSSGYQVKYIPINYFHRVGRSKIRPIHDTLNFLQLICRAVLWFNPLRIFIPMSLFFIALAFGVLGASWVLTGKAWDITFGAFVMTGVLVLAVGMLADLIDKRIDKYESVADKSSAYK